MSYKPENNSMMYGAYLSTSQGLPEYTTALAINYQFDYDSAVKSCESVNDVIIPNYPRSCAFADICMSSDTGYYTFYYGFSEGFRKHNAIVGRNQQARDDVTFDIITTSARVAANYTLVCSGNTRTLDSEGLNQLAGFFI